jgi:hypothetical protein
LHSATPELLQLLTSVSCLLSPSFSGFHRCRLTSAGAGLIKCFLLASPSKFSFSFSKFPEGGLILAIVVLGLLLAVFGGSVSRPKFEKNAEGKQERVYETDADGKKSPAFATVNKFFNLPTLIQIAKDTSFFAIMAVGMTFVIITGGIDLSVGATYAIASACRALVLSQFGAEGGTGSVLLGILVTIGVGILGGYSMDR